jgi:UDP-N-acetylmuramate-alanine ligase
MARRVGIVGIGIMGTAMMRNLARDGFEVVGYDVSERAMARLGEAGGIAATSPRDVAEKVEILIGQRNRRQASAADLVDPPPSGIRSPNSALRHSRFRSIPRGMRPDSVHSGRVRWG